VLTELDKAKDYWCSNEDQKAIDTLDIEELSTSAEALFMLGDIYNCADKRVGGVSRSIPKARKYWLEATQYGSSDAAVELGNLYYLADGVKQNYSKAEKFWLIAANAGHEIGRFKLADFYYDYQLENINDAIILFKSLIDEQSTFSGNSCCRLGRIYDRAKGVKRDSKQAALWYEKGAKLNHGNCLLDLSYLYYKGDGVVKNVELAINLAEKASKTEWLKNSAPLVVKKMRNGTLVN